MRRLITDPLERLYEPGAGVRRPTRIGKRRRAARRRPLSLHTRTLRLGVAALLVVALVGGGVWLWRSGTVEAMAVAARHRVFAATAEAGLSVRQVLLEGRGETSRGALMRALRVRRGQPILTFDPAGAKARLEALPWVRSAAVERRLPDIVYVRLVERRPMALWQNHGHVVLVDREGVVITDNGLERFADLPLIVGADAPRRAPEFLALLAAQPALLRRVSAAVHVGGRRWNLRLDNDIDVRLPERDPGAALARLAELDRVHRLLAREVSTVDLRVPDRLILKLAPGTAQRLRNPGRNT